MWINVNGIRMYYEKHGSGRPLIMVHGNSETHDIFYDAMVLLSKHFTVYTVDSRGHGYSTRVNEFHYADMTDDMIAFMDQLDLRDVIFYGFSDGGIIGLLAAMRCDRIGMLITSGANITPKGVKEPFRVFVRAAYAVTKDPKMALMLNEPNIAPSDLAQIKVPTVVMAGEKDVVVGKETVKIAKSIRGAKLRIIPGEGHGSYIVHKSRIADIIMEETGIIDAEPGAAITPAQMKALVKAQQGEADAVLMYRRLAGKVKDANDRAAFLRLADDEARHAEVFRKYTGRTLNAKPAKSVLIPLMYRTIGREKLYTVIARGEYDAAEKYKSIIPDFPEVETVMNDEKHHGDAVMNLLKGAQNEQK